MNFRALAPYFPPSFVVQTPAPFPSSLLSPSLSLPLPLSRAEHVCLPSLAHGCGSLGSASVLSGPGDRVLVRASVGLRIVECVRLVRGYERFRGREASDVLDGSLLMDEMVWGGSGIERALHGCDLGREAETGNEDGFFADVGARAAAGCGDSFGSGCVCGRLAQMTDRLTH